MTPKTGQTDPMPQTILILEQDLEIRKILQHQLSDKGYHVRCPVDTYVALECVDSQPIDLLIINDQMPIIKGKDALTILGLAGKQIPVIVFLPKSESSANYNEFANCHCVYKPFAVDTLIRKVTELLNM